MLALSRSVEKGFCIYARKRHALMVNLTLVSIQRGYADVQEVTVQCSLHALSNGNDAPTKTLTVREGDAFTLDMGEEGMVYITVYDVGYRKNQCRFAFDAPASIVIDREELYNRKSQQPQVEVEATND